MRTNIFFRPHLETVEDRSVPAAGFGTITDDAVAVSPDDGGVPRVKIVDPVTGEDVGEVQAYDDAFRGGVRVALGDVTGDGTRDVVIAPGPGGGPRIKVLDGKTGAQIADFFAYDPSFTNGLYVALGDVNGDGKADIITGTGAGGGPRVRVFDGAALGGTVLRDFFAYEGGFRGGVLVAAGDIDRDGKADIITGTGVGGGPRVVAFGGADNRVLANFFAYEDGFRGGVLVGAGDIDGDGADDILAGTGPGGGPVARAFRRDGQQLLGVLADDASYRGGVVVAAEDVNGDGRDDLVTRTRRGNTAFLSVFDSRSGGRIRQLTRTIDDNPSASDLAEGTTSTSTATTTTTVGKVEGSVTAVDAAGGTVTIQPASGAAVVVKTGPGTKVERNGAAATLAAFKPGDAAQARLGADGVALKVEATGS